MSVESEDKKSDTMMNGEANEDEVNIESNKNENENDNNDNNDRNDSFAEEEEEDDDMMELSFSKGKRRSRGGHKCKNEKKGVGNGNFENGNENRFPDRCARVLKENHSCFIENIFVCPFDGCGNILASAGGNQVSIYDCTNRGNFIDLVSNFFNLPNDINDIGEKIDLLSEIDTSHYNGKNPYALDMDVLDETPWKDKEFNLTKQQIESVSFNDVTWINKLKNNDLWVAAPCNDGCIYIISQALSHCVLLFPASDCAVKQILTHCSEPYCSNVIASIDSKHVTKLWNIDSIDCNNFKYDINGGLIEKQRTECLLHINDLLQCIVFYPYNEDCQNSTLLYGFTCKNKLKCFKIDHCNDSMKEEIDSNSNESKNNGNGVTGNESEEEEEDDDMLLMRLPAKKGKEKEEIIMFKKEESVKMADKWIYSVTLDEKIEHRNNSNKTDSLKNVKCMRWRPKGENNEYLNQLLMLDENGKFWLYNVSTKRVLHRFNVFGGITLYDNVGNEFARYTFDFTKDGKYIAYGNDDGLIHIYDLDNKKNVKSLEPDVPGSLHPVYHCRFAAPNEQSVIATSDFVIWKYDKEDWIKEYRKSDTFFENETPFSQLVKPDPTFVDF